MTNEEERYKVTLELLMRKCDDRKADMDCGSFCKLCVVRKEIYAVKKQIPIAPEVYETHPYPLYMCRMCGSTFVKNQFGIEMNYCPNCGQKQEWSNGGGRDEIET